MSDEAKFQCLRCGHEFMDHFVPKVVEERTCVKCHSNSVRRLKPKKAPKKKPAEAKTPPPA